MRYLFFDIECCDGKHLCSFGYVIIDENFKILEKRDIVINPQWRFKLGRAGFDPRIHLAYSEETFKKQKPFKYFYNEIKNLLTQENQVLLGHSISADIQYLKIACERYDNCPEIKMVVYDTQDFYYQLNRKYRSRALDKIVSDLGIDISNLQEHKSCDDAHISMLVTQEICNRLNTSLNELLELCDDCKRDGEKRELTEKQKAKRFSRDLKNIAEKYPNRNEWKSICLSDTIVEKDTEKRIALIKHIFEKGYNYICKVSECDYFVVGDGYGERDLSCDHNIEDNKKSIKKISISDLSKMLDVEINKDGELIVKEKIESEFFEALKNALSKKGMSYEEYLKKFD